MFLVCSKKGSIYKDCKQMELEDGSRIQKYFVKDIDNWKAFDEEEVDQELEEIDNVFLSSILN